MSQNAPIPDLEDVLGDGRCQRTRAEIFFSGHHYTPHAARREFTARVTLQIVAEIELYASPWYMTVAGKVSLTRQVDLRKDSAHPRKNAHSDRGKALRNHWIAAGCANPMPMTR